MKKFNRFMCVFAIVSAIAVFCGNAFAAVTAIERQALIDLYNSTNGDGWTNNSGWKTAPLNTDGFAMPGTECSWYGVVCDAGGNYVTEIALGSISTNNLVGTIPVSIGNLTNLQYLDLWNNQITGTIPAVLGSLSNLKTLYLHNNKLTGTIPSELGKLSNLTTLVLFGNQLTGSIPASLGNMSNLTTLVLLGNQLTGIIPAELGNLSNLTHLELSSNLLTGSIPAELGNLSNLTDLYLPNNQLTGSIPAALGNLSNLASLYLHNNQLTGNVPAELGNLSKLTSLYLPDNQLTGSVPAELGKLSSLTKLSLFSNKLTGSIPAELGNLSNLISLNLSSNMLTGSILAELGNLSNLKFIFLSDNQLTGSIPSTFGNFSQLQIFWLNNNQLAGPIPVNMMNLTNLDNGSGLHLCSNALYTTDTALRDFLNTKQNGGNWESCQKIAATAPTVTTDNVTNITTTSATCNGNVTSDGGATVTERGFCWSASLNPTITSSCTSDGTGIGEFTTEIVGLKSDTTYYIRAYAKNSIGTSYGNVLSFHTNTNNAPPSLTVNNGLTLQQGQTGIITNTVLQTYDSDNTPDQLIYTLTETPAHGTLKDAAINLVLSGTFTQADIDANQIYYNHNGDTSTADSFKFTVSDGVSTTQESVFNLIINKILTVPIVTTASVFSVTQTSATAGGNITSDGGSSITAKGVCWHTSSNPTIANSKTSDGTGLGSFTTLITGLPSDTMYYVRAYATNSVGTGYGSDITFRTLPLSSYKLIKSVSPSAGGMITASPDKTSYTEGETVKITATPNSCYEFTGFSGDCSGTNCTLTMNSDKTVTANFKLKTYSLNITAVNGTVTKNPDKTSYNCGETVTLTASPNTGYKFVSWEGTDSVSGNSATVNINNNRNITAIFTLINTYTLTKSALPSAGGMITASPDKTSYTEGETVKITATSNICYEFTGFSGDCSGTNCSLTMNSDKSVTANFKLKTFSLNISAANGTVTKNPDKTSYNCGETVTLTAAPNSCYEFTGWSGDYTGTGTTCTLTMDSNKSVTANFKLKTYSLNITAVNGTVTKNPDKISYNCGETVTLTASPNTGYKFIRWEGTDSASGNSATVNMNNNSNITAIFESDTPSGTSFRIWIDKNNSGSYDSDEGIESAKVFVNSETNQRGLTDSQGIISLQNIGNQDKIYVYKQLFGAENPKAVDSNFGTSSKNPYYASNSTDGLNGKMYYFVMASDIMADDGKYYDFPGQNKNLQNAAKDSGGNILVQLVHPKIEWNYVVAFEEGQSDAFYNKVKTGFRNYADYMYNFSDGYSVVRNVVFVKGAYKDTAQWDYCDVQIKNSAWPNAHIFGNRYKGKYHIHMGKEWEEDEPDGYNWYSTLGHESGHYLLGFGDEYMNGNYTKGAKFEWTYRKTHDGDAGEPNEFPKNYGLMNYQYNAHEMSDTADYFPRVYSPAMDDDLVTNQFKEREGQSCWTFFKSFYQNDIRKQMASSGFSSSFFDNLIIPPHTSGSYPNSDSTKRPEPSVMNHNTVNFIDWTVPASRSKSEKFYDALVYVLDENNTPVADADVWLFSDERKSFQGKTDKSGFAKAGSIVIGKRLEAYFTGRKADLELSEIKGKYTIILPANLKTREYSDLSGVIISAKPDSLNSKKITVNISGQILSDAPVIALSQTGAPSAPLMVESIGNDIYSGTAYCQYNSGSLGVAAAGESENPFETYGTDIGPASGYYAPNGELEMTYSSDTFEGSGYFVVLNSTAPAPANGNLKQVGNVKSIGFSDSVGKVGNVVFSIPLSETQLDGLDSSKLNLYGWNETNNTWTLISGGTNNLKYFSISLDTLDYVSYALFAPSSTDTTPPARITALKASTGDSRWSIILEWTAPSDSGKTVFAYDIRYNTVPVTDSNWNDSTSVSYVPSPETPGTVQTMTVEMPDPNTDYYFAVKSSDSAGNLSSATSSSKTGSTPNGDFNCNSELDLPDVVIALQIQASMDVISSCLSDINGDKKTGLEEVIYILQKLAGIKE